VQTQSGELLGCGALIQLAAIDGSIGTSNPVAAIVAVGTVGAVGTSDSDRSTLVAAPRKDSGSARVRLAGRTRLCDPVLACEAVAVARLARGIEFNPSRFCARQARALYSIKESTKYMWTMLTGEGGIRKFMHEIVTQSEPYTFSFQWLVGNEHLWRVLAEQSGKD
jgi:hypothetical protein